MNLARRRGLAIRFVTNTATRHHDDLLQDLQQLGFACLPTAVVSRRIAFCWGMAVIGFATPITTQPWSC